jgi:hypothetical protein
MRWPSAWKAPSALSLLKGTAINYLLIDPGEEFFPVRSRAREEGFQFGDAGSTPSGVHVVPGEFPGVRMGRASGADASSGPTGTPWVDSNGWAIRLAAALHPQTAVWVEAPPREKMRLTADSYLIAVADSAAYGGRWIISLDDALAAGIPAGKPESLDAWKKLAAAAGFFAARKAWSAYVPEALVGVVSDFTGDNEFFGHELLNLLARAGQQYRIIVKDKAAGTAFKGLRAVIYADAQPPSPALRGQITAYVQAGGMLITVPKWGELPGAPAENEEHPRFSSRILGRGKVAVTKSEPDDPWVLANDSVVLVSHRYDLLRFWNSGSAYGYYTIAPDRKRALVHVLFYAARGPDSASIRVAGRYRSAKLLAVDQPDGRSVEIQPHKDGTEVHLPQVPQYIALEFEV